MDYIYIILAILNLVILPLSVYYNLDYIRNSVVILDVLIFIYKITSSNDRKIYSLDEIRIRVKENITE